MTDQEYKKRVLQYILKVEHSNWIKVYEVTKGSGHERFVNTVKQLMDEKALWAKGVDVSFRNDSFTEFMVIHL